jgi:hypothetical protein
MRRLVHCIAVLVVLGACGDARDSRAASSDDGSQLRNGSATGTWPGSEEAGIHLRRERAAHLTGAAQPETIVVTAQGPRYDSLDIRLVIRSAAGDTLWSDEWNSSFYFYYDSVEGKTRLEVARMVQAHVDTLLHGSRFNDRGLPGVLSGADYSDLSRESVRHHLAELDSRRRAGLRPAQPTPRDAYDRIRVETVDASRVDAVHAEVSSGPTYWYYAGGEASYVIGWSVQESAFVRIFACC